ncbi:hypothetical protein ES705_31149 [subsurface metagenome]
MPDRHTFLNPARKILLTILKISLKMATLRHVYLVPGLCIPLIG